MNTETNHVIPQKRYQSLWPYAGIFIFIMLSVLIWGVILNGFLAENKMLFDKYYYSPEISSIGLKTDDQTNHQRLGEGLSCFAKGNYQDALHVFDQFPDDPLAMLCRSLSLIELGQAGLAIRDLDVLAKDTANVYHDQAKWYRALLHLKLNQPAQTKMLLENIAADHGIYKTKALKLLEELETD